MKKNVVVLAETASDIERGIDFYNAIEEGVGLYSETSSLPTSGDSESISVNTGFTWLAIRNCGLERPPPVD